MTVFIYNKNPSMPMHKERVLIEECLEEKGLTRCYSREDPNGIDEVIYETQGLGGIIAQFRDEEGPPLRANLNFGCGSSQIIDCDIIFTSIGMKRSTFDYVMEEIRGE